MARRFAAFLRGINVGGRRASNAELSAAFETVEGIEGAAPFIASGNVVFTDSARRKPATIAASIERSILDRFGWQSKVFLRDESEIAALSALQPFTEQQLASSRGKHQITFYDQRIEEGSAAAEILGLSTAEDRLVVAGRELHWLPSGGISESSLNLAMIERILGVGTMRTANTIRRLQARFFSD